MKNFKLIPVFILFALATGINVLAQNKDNKTSKKGFAVLELFTSEGCSSCPPADELMGKIQNEYKDSTVYILSYHVDYWDRLGWKDKYSSARFTQRQSDYSKWLNFSPIYTPQLIVNGKAGYIGSQEPIVRNAVTKALSKSAGTNLELTMRQIKNNAAVNYKTTGDIGNSQLLLAVVQKSAKSAVKRGENEGRTLSHFQIVRSLNKITIGADGKGNSSVALPKDFDPKTWEIVGFVQDKNTGAISGAAKTNL